MTCGGRFGRRNASVPHFLSGHACAPEARIPTALKTVLATRRETTVDRSARVKPFATEVLTLRSPREIGGRRAVKERSIGPVTRYFLRDSRIPLLLTKYYEMAVGRRREALRSAS